MNYRPSLLSSGPTEILREHTFTRWMSPEDMQTVTKHLRTIGMIALYMECSAEAKRRAIVWRPPAGCYFEVRSGCTREKFLEYERNNLARNCPLLSLHVNETPELYSAVWISNAHLAVGRQVLAGYGITPPEPE